MHRRHLLATAGLGLAGCLGRGGSETNTSSPDSASPLPLSVNLEKVHHPSNSEIASVSVKLVEPSITQEHTATISISFKNKGDKELEILGGLNFPFHQMESENLRWGLLHSPDGGIRVSSNCWEPKKGIDAFARPMSQHHYTLVPGEKREVNRWLWSHPEAEICMPTGLTKFLTDGIVDPRGEEIPIEWGFDLRIN